VHVASNVDLLLGHVDLLGVLDVDRVAAHVAQRTLCSQEHTLEAIRCVQRILNGFGLAHPWWLPGPGVVGRLCINDLMVNFSIQNRNCVCATVICSM
jgi:hypothetical protein